MFLWRWLHQTREPFFGARVWVIALIIILLASMGYLPGTSVDKIAADGTWIKVTAPMADEPDFQVAPLGKPEAPLLGTVSRDGNTITFHPAMPLLASQTYELRWRSPDGKHQSLIRQFTPRSGITTTAPTVQMSPQATLPANALKFYLHFSEPMEQGIFLERLRLLDGDGKEVIGPFRETELWSPDGKRLTVWFHPGRQKTGVNLNEDEGPVLRANVTHTLVIAGSWRSARGVSLGKDIRFELEVGQADHAQPSMKRWQITAPKAGTREPWMVHFDEPLDTAVITSALHLRHAHGEVSLGTPVISPDGQTWSVTPLSSWAAGHYELKASPDLEDLAGNSLLKPFEVNLQDPSPPSAGVFSQSFEIH
ncbi:MAG: Ig-like domain-containing protein [Verrucomicrobiota bacterium]